MSQYAANKAKAQALLRQGYWGPAEEVKEEKPGNKGKQEQAQTQKPAHEIPSDLSGSIVVKSGEQSLCLYPQHLSDEHFSMNPVYWDPLKRLAEKAEAAVQKFKEALQDPSTWKLVGHATLFAGVCTIGPWGIYKVWYTKEKIPALALCIPLAFTAYQR